MFVVVCTVLLLFSTLSYAHPSKRQINHSTDENFVFTKAEIATTVKLSDSTEVYVEAFKNKDNDNLIKQIESNPLKCGIGSLRFISLGYPQLVQSGSKRSTIPYFFLTAKGFTISIRTLTDEIRKALASAASTQYQVKIGSDQILLLVPTNFTCDMVITAEKLSYTIRGKSTTLNTNPIKVDFKVPLQSAERTLLESPSLTVEMLSLTCEVTKRATTAGVDANLTAVDYRKELTLDLGATAEILPTSTTSTTTTSITAKRCVHTNNNRSCQVSTDCCEWNTPDYKLIDSCGDAKICLCIAPGQSCDKGFRCCDGSICDTICPPAAKFHYCNTFYISNCQSGLTCIVDSVSLRIWPRETQYRGRCL